MDPAELASFETQLSQVNDALELDPSNVEFQSLKAELTNLIALTRQLHQPAQAESSSAQNGGGPSRFGKAAASAARGSSSASPAPTPASSASTANDRGKGPAKPYKFRAGEECIARYATDGKWYPAKITAIGGSSQSPVFSLVFKGYKQTEMLTLPDVRPTKAALEAAEAAAAQEEAEARAAAARLLSADGGSSSAPIPPPAAKRVAPTREQAEAERARKQRKREEKTENTNKIVKENANAWQSFAKKAGKKGGYGIAGAQGKSMFRSPDDPMAKIGVTGAGKGMTEYGSRSKHVYEGGSSSRK